MMRAVKGPTLMFALVESACSFRISVAVETLEGYC